jgi:hypothetical protein
MKEQRGRIESVVQNEVRPNLGLPRHRPALTRHTGGDTLDHERSALNGSNARR